MSGYDGGYGGGGFMQDGGYGNAGGGYGQGQGGSGAKQQVSIDGIPPDYVRIVARIVQISDDLVQTYLLVDDGSNIRVMRYNAEGDTLWAQLREQLHPGTWVSVLLKVSFEANNIKVEVSDIQPVTDPNAVTHHNLQARGFSSATAPAMVGGPDDVIHGVLRELHQHADQGVGVYIENLIGEVGKRGLGYDRNTIMEVLSRLSSGGQVFTTMDDQHYSTTD